MLPSDMNLKIKTGIVRYNSKILVSDKKFSLGKNVEVNSSEPAKVMGPPQSGGPGSGSHTTGQGSDPIALEPSIKSYKLVQNKLKQRNQLLMKMKKIALVLALAGGFVI